MNTYETAIVIEGSKFSIPIQADFFSIKNGLLSFFIYDEELEALEKAVFKEWLYVVMIREIGKLPLSSLTDAISRVKQATGKIPK